MLKYIVGIVLAIFFSGCGIADMIALPFRVTGAVVAVVTPDPIGESISNVGDTIDSKIPF